MTNSSGSIVYDVWGGECSMEHVARYAATVEQAQEMMASDLAAGYLVNTRISLTWGGDDTFDERGGQS